MYQNVKLGENEEQEIPCLSQTQYDITSPSAYDSFNQMCFITRKCFVGTNTVSRTLSWPSKILGGKMEDKTHFLFAVVMISVI